MDPEDSLGRLRWYNVGMGLLHAIQGIAVVALSNDFALPVSEAVWAAGPRSRHSDDDPLAWYVA